MKRFVFISVMVLAGLCAGQAPASVPPRPLPDYLNDTVMPLSPKEQEALRLAAEWSEKPVKPIRVGDGKVVYVLGSTMPTVIGAPMEISDIELEPGEQVNEILVGDSARWLVESGSSKGNVTHIFVKPLDAGLQTSLVVTTDRRAYHIKLVSQKSGYTPHVGFLYQEQASALAAKDRKERAWATTEVEGRPVDLSSLDFNYRVIGQAPWKPVQVYNDGRQTFIKLPEAAKGTETPVLLARQGRREMLVNYRFRNNVFEVDGLFEHLTLISGVGGDQKKIDIQREVKK
jgi:type IV secretion system protein VirB9